MTIRQNLNPFQTTTQHHQKNTRCARVITISSGKGGVGKSSMSINLAVELSRLKRDVCVFDADTNLANVNIMTGLNPTHTLNDVLHGHKILSDIVLRGPAGIHIIPAATGIMTMVDHDASDQQQLIEMIRHLEQDYDYLLIDTGAGISETVLGFLMAAPEVIMTITPEPTSLTDAFSLLKVLRKRGFDQPVQVLVNRAPSFQLAKQALMRFAGALKKYLGLSVVSPGYILEDKNVPRSIMVQRPFALMYPQSPASRCIRNFAQRLDENDRSQDFRLSDYLASQADHGEAKVTSDHPHPGAWLDDLLRRIDSEPFDQIEPVMTQISSRWSERLAREHPVISKEFSQGLDKAIHIAGKLVQNRRRTDG